MKYIDKPISLLRDIKKVYSNLRNEVNNNKEFVRIISDDNLKIVVKDIDLDSNFHFTIHNPTFVNGYSHYNIIFRPQNKNIPTETSTKLSSNGGTIEKAFSEWLNNIKFYYNLSIHPTDDVLNEYKLRFLKVFSFLDEDVEDDKPLKSKTRKQISFLIDKVIDNLEVEKEENIDLIESLRELNKQLPQLTKRQVKESLSWTFAKIYYKGVDVVNWIAKQGASAGFGHLLIEGLKSL